ncbi:MAG: DNA methyltransferase, partial [Spirulinaceae cyanobacterium]
MALNFERIRDLVDEFCFQDVFIEELGWDQPSSSKVESVTVAAKIYNYQKIAEAAKVAIFEVKGADGEIPDGQIRTAIHKEIEQRVAENLLIFVDEKRTRSLWYWVKREGTKRYIRDHLYVRGQPGDLFLSKLSSLVLDITKLEEYEELSVVEVAQKLKSGFDIERVTKKFYQEFQQQHLHFLDFVAGIDKETDRRWYTSVLLNRLMFVYFLQRKGFIDGDLDYLQNKLAQSKARGENRYYPEFLTALFFAGFGQREVERDEVVVELIGKVKYLNGGLFLEHPIEQKYKDIAIADAAFEEVLDLFSRYSWNLDDTPEGKDDEINPDVLGYIFEKYINQKEYGAYYTRPEITEYLCDRTINKLIVDRVNNQAKTNFPDIKELLLNLDAKLCRLLVEDILPNLTILDPACGSGAFLVAGMKTLISVYTAVIGTIELTGSRKLKKWLKEINRSHPSLAYFVKKRIITDNLYGVDIMEEATEIAKLRLFLALVSSAQTKEELEPLPNIDFNIMVGNSLIGLIRVDEESFDTVGEAKQGNLLQPLAAKDYQETLAEKNESVRLYKEHAFKSGEVEGTQQSDRLQFLRDDIQKVNAESTQKLNQLLFDEFGNLKIKYEQAQLQGKAKKRLLEIEDIARLKPFHWGYHFDEVIADKGGFDAIITNPPWEIFKPQAKEFFAQYSDLVTKNKMDIKAFEKQQKKMLQNSEVAEAWLSYKS